MITRYKHRLLKNARQLRNNSTMSEVILWSRLKQKKMGFTFLRQKPLLDYIVDFYCPMVRLVIEVDGSSHNLKYEEDIKRDFQLQKNNIRVLRVNHLDILNNIDGVVLEIKREIKSLSHVST